MIQLRKAKVIYNKSGGTSSKSGVTNRITIPSGWIKEMGITEDSRNVILSFDGCKITISKVEDE